VTAVNIALEVHVMEGAIRRIEGIHDRTAVGNGLEIKGRGYGLTVFIGNVPENVGHPVVDPGSETQDLILLLPSKGYIVAIGRVIRHIAVLGVEEEGCDKCQV
jgi:hypothetical protein